MPLMRCFMSGDWQTVRECRKKKTAMRGAECSG